MSRKIRALIALTRPPNSTLMFIAVISGILLSDEKIFQLDKLILAFITAYSLCGASMAFNDYFDKEVDRVNAPWRPIPSGAISGSEAIILSAALGTIGIISAAATSLQCLIVAAAAFLVALIYNAKLKKTGLFGNMLVSVDVVIPFIYGAVLSDGYISPRIITFIFPVYLSNLGREIIKGISDIEGDSLREIRSIARTKGAKIAARLGALFYLAAVLISPIPYILNLVNWIYLPIVAIADAGFVYSSISIIKSSTRENSLKVKKRTLLWMLIALIAFIAGAI